MFVGRYTHKLNTKGQVAVPVKMRLGISADEQGNRALYLTKLQETPLYALTAPVLEELSDKLSEVLRADRRRRHEFYSRIEAVDIDPQGRVVIPQWMRLEAGIEKDVVFVGAGSRIEIWPAAAWDEYIGADEGETQKDLDISVSEALDSI